MAAARELDRPLRPAAGRPRAAARPRRRRGPARVPGLDGDLARARGCCAPSTPPPRASGSSCGRNPAHEILRDLEPGAADLAITSARPARLRLGRRCRRSGWCWSSRPATGCGTGARVSLTELADEELVTTPVGFGFRTLVDGLLRGRRGRAATVSFESQDLATIEGLVAAGLGVALVPEQFAGQSGTVGVTPDRAGRAPHHRADLARATGRCPHPRSGCGTSSRRTPSGTTKPPVGDRGLASAGGPNRT